MAQQVKTLVGKPHDLSSNPQTYVVERELIPAQVVLWLTHTWLVILKERKEKII